MPEYMIGSVHAVTETGRVVIPGPLKLYVVEKPATHLQIPPAADPAQAEALSVFGALAQTCDQTFPSGTDLSTTDFGSGVGNVPPGVYCSDGSFLLTNTLNLTGSGVWIFRTESTLITSSSSSVTGGDPCNVWWRIGSSTTLGTSPMRARHGLHRAEESLERHGRPDDAEHRHHQRRL